MSYLRISADWVEEGYIDILPLVAAEGLKFKRSNYTPSSITTMDGVVHLGRVRRVREVEVTCLPLSTDWISVINYLLESEYIEITTDLDPYEGLSSFYAFCESNPSNCIVIYDDDGNAKWDGVSFTLKER